jgi:hypothetical protein
MHVIVATDRSQQSLTAARHPIARWQRRQLEVCGICGTAVEV